MKKPAPAPRAENRLAAAGRDRRGCSGRFHAILGGIGGCVVLAVVTAAGWRARRAHITQITGAVGRGVALAFFDLHAIHDFGRIVAHRA